MYVMMMLENISSTPQVPSMNEFLTDGSRLCHLRFLFGLDVGGWVGVTVAVVVVVVVVLWMVGGLRVGGLLNRVGGGLRVVFVLLVLADPRFGALRQLSGTESTTRLRGDTKKWRKKEMTDSGSRKQIKIHKNAFFFQTCTTIHLLLKKDVF